MEGAQEKSDDKNKAAHSLQYTLFHLLKIAWEASAPILIFLVISTVITGLCPVSLGILQQLLIDYFVPQSTADVVKLFSLTLLSYLVGRAVVTTVQAFFNEVFVSVYLVSLLRNHLQNALGYKFACKLAALDLEQFENPAIQNLIVKARSTYLWRPIEQLGTFMQFFGSSIGCFSAFIILLQFNVLLPVLLALATVPRLIIQIRSGQVSWAIWDAGAPQQKELQYYSELFTHPTSILELRLLRATHPLLDRFKALQQALYDINKKALDYFLVKQFFPFILEGGILLSVACMKITEVLAGEMTIGRFTLFLVMCEQFIASAIQVVSTISKLNESSLFSSHFFEVMNLPRVISKNEDSPKLHSAGSPKIEFRNVSFAYPGGKKVLDNISFTIEPGESVALVGVNGAGKSTIVKLLCRFYSVCEGEILINDRNIDSLGKDDWYEYLGILPQKFTDFQFTVKENIVLGMTPNCVDDNRVEIAAQAAQAHGFISKLERQYNQRLGRQFEDGVELSWGQWQKLAIARAFYQKPWVLILDEPTSAIDAEAENEIFKELFREFSTRTLIFVSHRFSAIRKADRIVVIDGGKVIEEGSHRELMVLDGKYSELFTTQSTAYLR